MYQVLFKKPSSVISGGGNPPPLDYITQLTNSHQLDQEQIQQMVEMTKKFEDMDQELENFIHQHSQVNIDKQIEIVKEAELDKQSELEGEIELNFVNKSTNTNTVSDINSADSITDSTTNSITDSTTNSIIDSTTNSIIDSTTNSITDSTTGSTTGSTTDCITITTNNSNVKYEPQESDDITFDNKGRVYNEDSVSVGSNKNLTNENCDISSIEQLDNEITVLKKHTVIKPQSVNTSQQIQPYIDETREKIKNLEDIHEKL